MALFVKHKIQHIFIHTLDYQIIRGLWQWFDRVYLGRMDKSGENRYVEM